MRINPKATISDKKEYRVVVWDYELLLPWSETPYGEFVAARAEAFQQQYPNIIIHLVMRPWAEDDGPLRDVIEQGDAPDVVNMPGGVRLLSRDFQVPLEHYIPADQKDNLLSTARQGATLEHLWAFPSHINPARWIIRAGSPPPSTWLQWSDALAEHITKNGGKGLAANVLDPAFFHDLMVSATGQNLLGPDGTIQWSEDSIKEMAARLRAWVEKGLIPKEVEKGARTRLAHFWDGNALGLAPTTPWLLHHILQRVGMLDSPQGGPGAPKALDSVEHIVHWVPPPQVGEQLWVAATLNGYAVFTQNSYKGDDHTRAAALVAAYLAEETGAWVAARTFSAPTHRSGLEKWLSDALLPEQDMRLLLDWSSAAVIPPLEDRLARLQDRILAENVVPKLAAVLKGDISETHFARELQSIPVSALAADNPR